MRNFSTRANTTHGFSSLKTKDDRLVSMPHMINAEKNLFREVSTAGVLLVIFSSAGSLWTPVAIPESGYPLPSVSWAGDQTSY